LKKLVKLAIQKSKNNLMPPITPNAKDFKARDIKVLKKLLPYFLKMKYRIILALSFLLLAKVANVGIPLALKEIVDSLDSSRQILVLPLGFLIAYGVLRLASSLFNELRDAVFAKFRYQTMREVSVSVFKHLHKLDLGFHLDRKIGSISRDIDRGTNSISTLLSILIFNIFPSIFEVALVVGILLFNYDSIIAITALSTVVFYILLTLKITSWRMKYRYEMNDTQSEANNTALDSLINYETVKYFNQEKAEIDKYQNAMIKWQNVAVKSFTSMTALNFAQGSVIAIGVTIILILASQGVVDGSMTLGDLIMIQALLLQLFLPLGNLGIVYRQIKHNFIDMNNMFDLIDRKPKIVDEEKCADLKINNGNVEFRDVNFSYNNKQQILKNLNFEARRGEKVAIVGSSGAGKSTIAKLLFRFFDIQAGEILIDNQNIAKISQLSLRQNISVVPQDTILFNDTIFNNIKYGTTKSVDLTDIKQVAKLSFIDDFIESLPDGYDTIVGERGLKLSGGEKQRLAIARALLKNPQILIFDEATSALDNKSEEFVQKAMDNLRTDKTIIVIAHRLSTIKDADKIIVIGDGSVMESGTHAELMAKKSTYYQMNADGEK
jgi:ABC-type transport system involved in Fe-S cluster assembly fused permease/ATPase subunit